MPLVIFIALYFGTAKTTTAVSRRRQLERCIRLRCPRLQRSTRICLSVCLFTAQPVATLSASRCRSTARVSHRY